MEKRDGPVLTASSAIVVKREADEGRTAEGAPARRKTVFAVRRRVECLAPVKTEPVGTKRRRAPESKSATDGDADADRKPKRPWVRLDAVAGHGPAGPTTTETIERPDELVAGVDEAGRGAVLGDMVFGLVVATRAKEALFRRAGVRDSKEYKTDKQKRDRTEHARMVQENAAFWTVRSVSAETISARGGKGQGELNAMTFELLLECARAIPDEWMPAELVVDACEVDLVKVARVFDPWVAELVARGVRPPRVRPSNKADVLFPIVSAASVVAKEHREGWVEGAKEKLVAERDGTDPSAPRDPLVDPDIGSGYPSDKTTMAWVERYYLSHGKRFHRFTRTWWKPCAKLELKHASTNIEAPIVYSSSAEGNAKTVASAVDRLLELPPNVSFVRGNPFEGALASAPLMHPCACEGLHAQGFTWDVLKAYPEVDVYKRRGRDHPEDEPGTVVSTRTSKGRLILSAVSQRYAGPAYGDDDGEAQRAAWFEACLERAAEAVEREGLSELCLPQRYGCEGARTDWSAYRGRLFAFARRRPGLSIRLFERTV